MPPPISYAISSRLPESFAKNSIQDILESKIEKTEREERELLTVLGVDFVDFIYDSSDDEMDPSIYQYISMVPIWAPHLMM